MVVIIQVDVVQILFYFWFMTYKSGAVMSWLLSYGSWIYNYLCNQCLSPLVLWVWTPFMVRCIWYNILWLKFVSDLRQVGGFLRVFQFPSLMAWYSWNIVESGIKHHKPSQTCYKSEIITSCKTKWHEQVEIYSCAILPTDLN